jgi:glycosyltransferase involved in cell wall biosynthesis
VSPALNPVREHSRPFRSFLLVCDEWAPSRGGISTVNRALAIELAAQGQGVSCLVKNATPVEIDDAVQHGVQLVVAETTPRGPELLLPVDELTHLKPDIVIGHDRVTGGAAWVQARKHLDALLVHVVHTAPAELERYKNTGCATVRIEERERFTRQMATRADVLAAVGPRLTSHTASLVEDGTSSVDVLRLDPGFDQPGRSSLPTSARVSPARPLVLVLGRTDDIVVKGLDIAAGAVAALPTRSGAAAPTLLVRGAPAEQCDALHDRLVTTTGLARQRLDIRPFTTEDIETRRDLVRASVCLMPSRAEGFGMSATEAISLRTPVLVSARSGLADVLYEVLGRSADAMVLEIAEDAARDRNTWSHAVRKVLEDVPGAFAFAAEVRERLTARFTWRSMVRTLLDRLSAL